MEQVEAIRVLADAATHFRALVVSDVGSQSGWLYSTGDRPEYLYLTGPMGSSAAVALGVALAVPSRPVLAICGDGALAMCLASLPTIAAQAPKNLTIAVIDNGTYELTGNLRSPSASVNWSDLVRALPPFRTVEHLTSPLPDLTCDQGPAFIHCAVTPATARVPHCPVDPLTVHRRFLDVVREINGVDEKR